MRPLRQRPEDKAGGVHEQVDALLDSADSMIILIDGRRAISYVRGFGLSACQLELLAHDIERLVRTVTRAPVSGEGCGRRRGRLLRLASEPTSQRTA
jgi:hypothetical protein